MDIRVLQYFLAVARESSITKAAESLNMTQLPLSRQLKELEDELGKQLLIHGNRKVTLTEEGMILRKNSPLCFRPLEPQITVGLDIIWKKYQVFTKPATFFLNMLREEIALLGQ